MLKIHLLLILLPFILWTSYTDIRENKISNRAIAVLLTLGVILNVAVFPENIKIWLMNGLFMSLGVVLLWLGRALPAADGKLLLAYVFFIPLAIYDRKTPVPSFSILINTFVPFFIFFLIQIFKDASGSQKKKAALSIFNIREILRLIINVFMIQLLIMMLSWAGINLIDNYFLNVLLVIVMYGLIRNLLDPVRYFYLIIIALIVTFPIGSKYALAMIGNTARAFLALLFLRYLNEASSSVFSKEIPIDDLKEGMQPLTSFVFYSDIQKYRRRWSTDINIFPTLVKPTESDALLFPLRPEGLTKNDIDVLKEARDKNMLTSERIYIQKTIPFAPILAVGVTLTILFSGDIFHIF